MHENKNLRQFISENFHPLLNHTSFKNLIHGNIIL